MTVFLIIVVLWFACSFAGYKIMKWDWLQDFDLTRKQRRDLIFENFIMGPIALIGALFIILPRFVSFRNIVDLGDDDEIVEKRKEYD